MPTRNRPGFPLLHRIRNALSARTPFKSQKGQDRWVIFHVLPFRRNGFFVDLAAADGVTHSNTYALEKFFGWTGICIEGNPQFIDTLRRTRRCNVVASVVDTERGEVDFRIDNGQLGGIVAADTDNNLLTRRSELSQAQIARLRAEPLADILDRHHAPRIIDYLSLDVEGSEERVLLGFPHDKYIFLCATIERPTPRLNAALFEAGYVFVRNVRFDSFYVHHTMFQVGTIRVQPFEQVPPKDW